MLETKQGPKIIHSDRVGESPGTREAVARVFDALRTETLRTAFVKGNAIFEIGSVPSGNTALFGASLNKAKGAAHEFAFADGMLRDEPGGFGRVGAGGVFGGPC